MSYQKTPRESPQSASAQQRIFQVLHRIPCGKVATYGQIAELAGLPRAARLVGTTLKKLPEGSNLPWHRVINAAGKISFPPDHPCHLSQRQRLMNEGVIFTGSKVDLKRFQWRLELTDTSSP